MNDIVDMQRRFDSVRETTFPWSLPISEENTTALTHNVLALAGEVGELANWVKKYERGDFPYDKLRMLVPGELADVLIYIMKIAYQSGVNLEEAFLQKFAENQKRFPEFDEARTAQESEWDEDFPEPKSLLRLDATQLGATIQKWATRAAFLATNLDVQALESSARRGGLTMPSSLEGKFTVALLAIIFTEAGFLEGRPQERDDIWARLAPSAASLSLSRSQVASLTSRGEELTTLLSQVLARKEGERDE